MDDGAGGGQSPKTKRELKALNDEDLLLSILGGGSHLMNGNSL